MREVYLFDWGDTLMVDFPDAMGKMCDWKQLETVDFAKETLQRISKKADIYIATAAADSSPQDIKKAFARVGLDSYINGYFCKQNTGFTKPSPEFYQVILKELAVTTEQVTMVGDSLEKDILPCHQLGFKTFWLSTNPNQKLPEGVAGVVRIATLNELS